VKIRSTVEYIQSTSMTRWSTMYSARCVEYKRSTPKYIGVLCTLHGVRCTLLGARCTLLGARCTLLGARCTLHGAPHPPLPHLPHICPPFPRPPAASPQHSALSTQHSALSKHSAPIRGAAAASRVARRPSPNTPSIGRAGAASPSPTRASLPCWSRPCACPSSARRSPSASPPSRCS